MSNENTSGSAASEHDSNQAQAEKEAYVSRKAYEEVTRDMHKNKQKAKELEAAYNELQAQLKAQEEQKLQEQGHFQELYEKTTAELEQERQKAKQERDRYMRSVKLAALKHELGVSIRDEYLGFAPLDSIALTDEGSIDKDSLREVANSFRKEHGQLIPSQENVNITGQAASNHGASSHVDTSKMSSKDLVAYYANLKSKQ